MANASRNKNNSSNSPLKGIRRRGERNTLTFYEKIAVIRYYEESNMSRNSLAKMFHCCATQIRRILDKKHELVEQLATMSESDASLIIEEMTRKRRKFEMFAISFILHKWVERCRQMRLRKSITNQVLKDTAVKMSAILNLPSFRPSYRWLNRFRGKYKYHDEDLGLDDETSVQGELAVEDIIIEFKDSLPSFMQKEISAVTSISLGSTESSQSRLSHNNNNNDNNNIDSRLENIIASPLMSGDSQPPTEESYDSNAAEAVTNHIMESIESVVNGSCDESTEDSLNSNREQSKFLHENTIRAGNATLLSAVYPHLAVIHQFALLNSDAKALELVSQLGIHLQTQASTGAYKRLSLAVPQTQSSEDLYSSKSDDDGLLYIDELDSIVLMEQ